MNQRVIRVAIADDHHLFRAGLVALLAQDRRVVVVGQAATSAETMALVHSESPNVLLLDVEMDHVPAEVNVRRLRRHNPGVRVVILTMHNDSVLERQLRAAGVADYMTKDATVEKVILRIVRALDRPSPPPPIVDASRRTALSDRELQVLRMISQAQTNRAIGEALSITEGTVKRHVVNIFAKLGASSRIDAVRRGYLLGQL